MIKRLFYLLLFTPLLVKAHGGEDHGEAKTVNAKTATYFSSEASSDLYELLVKYQPLKPGKEGILKLYVSNFSSNLPIDSATLQITVSGNPNIKLTVTRLEKGIYEVKGIFPEKKYFLP